MAEQLRQHTSSPLSASPGRVSRPHWPWSTYTHRSSSSSIHSVPTPPIVPQQSPAIWDPRSSASSTQWQSMRQQQQGPSINGPVPAGHDENMRHWNFTAFEWVVRDVRRLKEFVEGREHVDADEDGEQASLSAGQHEFEIFKESPTLGDGKFKLEIARAPITDHAANFDGANSHALWLSITSLLFDFAPSDAEINASLMAAIKAQDDKAGERGARPDWAWETWQNEWCFRQESEVWECPFPSLTSLLENNERIRETDSFVICVQIHSPLGPFFPQQPSAYYVPRDLLNGLEASLDNPNTGDVRFICLERMTEATRQQYTSPSPPVTSRSASRRSSSESSHTTSGFSPHTTARKRVIYAHSDILIRRSEYFATMLSSSFSEASASNAPNAPGDRRICTIVVEEADFDTVYWLLKWVYANWLLFREEDDPRASIEGVGAGWSAKWLTTSGGEWEWKTFAKGSAVDDVSMSGREDAWSAASGDSGRSVPNAGETRSPTSAKPKQVAPVSAGGATPTPTASSLRPRPGTTAAKLPQSPSTARHPSSSMTTTRRSTSSHAIPPSANPNVGASPSPSRTKPMPIPGQIPTSQYPLSPHNIRSNAPSASDPHQHPTPAPPPASALSMYQVAHRYAIPGLAALALEHMMTTITPKSSFALLLATSLWEELRALIEDYVVDRWEEVSVTEEFEKCCEEVAAGEWGPEGGKTLMQLFRRLRSPQAMVFTRS